MTAQLAGCRLKIARAKVHRDSLQKHALDFFAIETNVPRFRSELDRSTGDHVFRIDYMPELGDVLPRCSVICGDVVHNLRSALDHLVFQLAVFHTGGAVQRPDRLQFPICDCPSAFNKQRALRLSEVAAPHVDIVERYQGYHQVDTQISVGQYFHPLSMLRDLNNNDKHQLLTQLLIPTTGMKSDNHRLAEIMVLWSFQQALRGAPISQPQARLGAEFMRVRMPNQLNEPPLTGFVTPTIAIDQERGAIPVLDKISRVVANLVDEFEPLIAATTSDGRHPNAAVPAPD